MLFGLATGAVSSPFVIYASRHLGLGDKVPHIALPSLLADIVDHDVWCNRQERAALGRKVALVAWPCALLAPSLVMAWRYPLGRRAHGVLARRIASRAG